MSGFRLLGNDEFMADWQPRLDKVFRPLPEKQRRLPGLRPFQDDTWIIVAMHGAINHGDFGYCERDPETGKWDDASIDDIDILYDTWHARGIREALVTERPYTNPKRAPKAALPVTVWDAALVNLDPGTVRSLMNRKFEVSPWYSALVGEDQTWGLIAVDDPTVSILGGTPDFMNDYLARAGGLQAVKERFQYSDVMSGGLLSVMSLPRSLLSGLKQWTDYTVLILLVFRRWRVFRTRKGATPCDIRIAYSTIC